MSRLDDDVQKAIAKMKGFIKMVQKRKMSYIGIIKKEGTKIPNVSYFQIKPYYDEYGKNVIYWYDKNSNYIMLLGKYSHQEIMDSSLEITKLIKQQHIHYMGIKRYNFVYLTILPHSNKPSLKITTEIDAWRGYERSNLYVYHLKPDILFMNWQKNPLEGRK